MQTYPVLYKPLTLVFRRTALNAHCRTTTHVIHKVVAVVDFGETQERQQFVIELSRFIELTDCRDCGIALVGSSRVPVIFYSC